MRIALRPEVAVPEQQVSLGEVANITSRDLSLLQRLMALPLGQVPRSGDAVRLDRDVLMLWIHARLGIAPQRIDWTGPSQNHVRLALQTITGERIAAVAQAQLQATLTKGGWRGEIALLQAPRDFSVPSGRLELKVRPAAGWQMAGASLPKRQSVWTDLWVDDRFVRTVPVDFELSVFAPAYVAATDLGVGRLIDLSSIDGSTLAVREVEWSGRSSTPLAVSRANDAPTTATRASLKLRHPLAAGQPVTHADVEVVPMVARGDYATLHAIDGPIELQSRVEVLQDGAAGASVRVRLPHAASAIVARVTGPGAVEVRE